VFDETRSHICFWARFADLGWLGGWYLLDRNSNTGDRGLHRQMLN
jgi:hypothetical protein